jgi:transcriptional regulator with XRE-family HTH domain
LAKAPNEICSAVKLLRMALQENQEQFARRLNTALRTVARYESTRPPKGRVLAYLEQIAMQHGFDEYAAVFRHALASELGLSSQSIPIREPRPAKAVPEMDFQDSEERMLCAALLLAIRDEKFKDKLVTVKRALNGAKQEVAERLWAINHVLTTVAAYGRLRKEGKTHEEIAQMLSVPAETLHLLVTSFHPEFGMVSPEIAERIGWSAFGSAIAMGLSAKKASEQFNMPEYISLALEKAFKEVSVPMRPLGNGEEKQ